MVEEMHMIKEMRKRKLKTAVGLAVVIVKEKLA